LDKTVVRNWRSEKEVMKLLLDRRDHEVQIARVLVAQIAESFDDEVITLLLNRRGEDVKITEEVVKVAGNRRSGKEVMTLQLNAMSIRIMLYYTDILLLQAQSLAYFVSLAVFEAIDEAISSDKIVESLIRRSTRADWFQNK
jgi:hypothetical protein